MCESGEFKHVKGDAFDVDVFFVKQDLFLR